MPGARLCIQAILYSSPTDEEVDKQCKDQTLPSGLEVRGPVLPPPLVGPSVQYSSVLIIDVKSSNAITIRYGARDVKRLPDWILI